MHLNRVWISLNSSGENYANVVLPSDSTSSDPTKSVIPEVSYPKLSNPMDSDYFLDRSLNISNPTSL